MNLDPLSEPYQEYFTFLRERMSIWRKKTFTSLPPPWTEDVVLRHAKFTNLYRELDRNTVFELAQLEKEPDPIKQMFIICLFRHTNSPGTFKVLMDPNVTQADVQKWSDSCENRKDFVSDAMLFNPGKKQSDGSRKPRVQTVFDYSVTLRRELNDLFAAIQTATTASDVAGQLMSTLPGVGNFFAYEYYTSFTYCDWFKWTEDDFVTIGPGVPPTLSYLAGINLDGRNLEEFHKIYQVCYDYLMNWDEMIWIPKEFQPKNPVDKKFTLRTQEHSLCEFRKYCNIWGGSKVRRKYHGGK